MGAKRWQLEEKDREILKLKKQLAIAIEGLRDSAEYFERFDSCRFINQALTKIKALDEEAIPVPKKKS